MRRLVFLLLFPCLLQAGEFEWMTREFARQSGTQPMHIPFFGLARFVVGVAHPAGTHDLRLAIFEHANVRAEQFSLMADSTVGQNWKPIVRVRESSGEVSNIYVQQDGKRVRVLVASRDKDEVVFVQVSIKPTELMNFLDERQHTHHA